jgi:hypothetical protein
MIALPRELGSPRVAHFQISGFEPTVVTCLTAPHPRLGTRYRVTQIFHAHEALSGTTPIIEFSSAEESAGPEDGSPCRAR